MTSADEFEDLPVSTDDLAKLSQLASDQAAAEQKVREAESALAQAKRELAEIAEQQLPELMTSFGLLHFKTTSGLVVDVSSKTFGSISDDNKPKAFEWLRENNYARLIKNVVSVKLDRGEDDKARKLLGLLRDNGHEPETNMTVHPQTLGAWLKEIDYKSLRGFPEELFGVHERRCATIALPTGNNKKGK
jgi:hypothetical protein